MPLSVYSGLGGEGRGTETRYLGWEGLGRLSGRGLNWEWVGSVSRSRIYKGGMCVGEWGYLGQKRMALVKMHSIKQRTVQGGLRAGCQGHGTNYGAATEVEIKLWWVHRDGAASRKWLFQVGRLWKDYVLVLGGRTIEKIEESSSINVHLNSDPILHV